LAHPFLWVDVFAEARYGGNPLAVLFDAADLSGAEMQRVAAETNLAETAFVTGRAEDAWRVRIFTPVRELPFAGHPTLGSAWAIRALRAPGAETLVLALDAGAIPVRFEAGAAGERAWLTSPPVELGPEADRGAAARAVGLEMRDLAPELPVRSVAVGPGFLFVPVASRGAVARARPDPAGLEALARTGAPPSAYVFCADGGDREGDGRVDGGGGRERSDRGEAAGADAAVRMFAPALGVPEDPATGSAAAGLGAYWLAHGDPPGGALDWRLEQGTERGRPSALFLRARRRREGASEIQVGGAVVPVAEGRWGIAAPGDRG